MTQPVVPEAMPTRVRSMSAPFAAVLAFASGALEPLTAHAQESVAVVPLCPGLKIVTAITQAGGDYESIKTIESASDGALRLKYTSERLVTDLLDARFGQVEQTTVYRSVLDEDLASASFYQQRYFEGMPEAIPGSTAIGISAQMLQQLKSGAAVELAISNAYSGEFGIEEDVRPNLYDFRTPGTIMRAQAEPVMLPVLVNDVAASLPAVLAIGDFAGEAAEFYFLDDEANPLALKFRLGIGAVPPMAPEMVELCREIAQAAPEISAALCTGGEHPGDSEVLQVVSISFRCDGAPPAGAGTGGAGAGTGTGAAAGAGSGSASAAGGAGAAGALSPGAAALEQALEEDGAAVVYDIHFSFNSASIRAESARRLEEIADVLSRHPEWRLAVNGHTDNIASDAYNLELSRERAQAVKAALVTGYGVETNRLVTAGYGEAQPRDTNDTIEGRARNRRVELIKQ